MELRDAGLTLKPSKCFLGYDRAEYLGHRIANGCLYTQEDKIEKLLHAPPPHTKQQLRSFIGLASFYRKFIDKFSDKAKCLTDLTKKNSPNQVQTVWTEKHQGAFELLKRELSCNPVLKLPESGKSFTLRSDASNDGIGAVLLQEHDGILMPTAYASRKLQPNEIAYSVIEKECLAIVWAVRKFHIYLFGQEFFVEVDHRPLSYLAEAKFTNPRVMRWALSLQPYKYSIKAIKGSENGVADYMSRM